MLWLLISLWLQRAHAGLSVVRRAAKARHARSLTSLSLNAHGWRRLATTHKNKDPATRRVVGTASMLVERKFIRGVSKVVVCFSVCEGWQLMIDASGSQFCVVLYCARAFTHHTLASPTQNKQK